MKLFHNDDHESQRMALQRARKQAQAGAERALADSDKYNAVLRLFIVDDQLKRLVDAYCALGHAARGELARDAQRLLAGGQAVAP